MKEKPLFTIDPSSFIKMKALKVIPTDTNSNSNIMRLYFPRNKNVEKTIKSGVKSDSAKTSEPTTLSSVNQFSEKELKKDFIEVDDILLVRDPKKIDELLKSQQVEEVTVASSDSSTLPTTESIQSSDNKPEKKNLEELFNQSERYKKLVSLFNANKSEKPESFNKSSNDRGLFKREGKLIDQVKDMPDTTNKPEDVSRNSDFDIVSSPSNSTEVSATQTIENSTDKVEQISTTTETSVKTEEAERQGQTTEASKSDSADSEMLGASLADLQADEKILDMDQKIIAEQTKVVDQDEQKLKEDKAKRDQDRDTLNEDKMIFANDEDEFSIDLTRTTNSDDDDVELPKNTHSSKDIQTEAKKLEFERSTIANETKQLREDEDKVNIDKGMRDLDKSLLDMNKAMYKADKNKFLADLESLDTTGAPTEIKSQPKTTEKPDEKQAEAPTTPNVSYFCRK